MMSNWVSIEGLDKTEVLYALYAAAKPPMPPDTNGTQDLTLEEFRRGINAELSYTVLHGRAIRVHFTKGGFNPQFYNDENGNGRAEWAIAQLRAKVGAGVVTGSH